jgi:hypothetical protein
MKPRTYADVVVRRGHHDGWIVLINGEDMANQIPAGSLHIDFPADEPGCARVTMTLRGTADLDLPNSQVVEVVP